MNTWKVILATLVIYGAGILTGALVFKSPSRPPVAVSPTRALPAFPGSDIFQERFFERMKKDLDLTPEQNKHLQGIFRESRERMKTLWDIVSPEMQAELQAVREKIQHELTVPQREKFETLLKERRRGPGPNQPGENRSREHRPSTPRNQPHRPGDAPSSKPPADNAPSAPSAGQKPAI